MKGKVTEVLRTMQEAQPQTLPQIHSSNRGQSAAHPSSRSTSLLHEEPEACPSVDVTGEYPDRVQLLGACSFVYTKSRYLCSQALQIHPDVPGEHRPRTQFQSVGPRGVRWFFSIPSPTRPQPPDPLWHIHGVGFERRNHELGRGRGKHSLTIVTQSCHPSHHGHELPSHWASDLEILGVNSHGSYFLFATKYPSSFVDLLSPSIILKIQPQCPLNLH